MKKNQFSEEIMMSGYRLFKANKVRVLSQNEDIFNFSINTEKLSVRIISHNKLEGMCSCSDFVKNDVCAHLTASLFELRTYRNYQSISLLPDFFPVKNFNNQAQFRLIGLLKESHELQSNSDIFPSQGKAPFDEIFYEIIFPDRTHGRNFKIFFHTASKLKSGNVGRFKNKRLKISDFIKSDIDHEVLKELLPFVSDSDSRYYSRDLDTFNGADLGFEDSRLLIDIIRTGKAFTQKRMRADNQNEFKFIKVIDQTINTHLKVDSEKFKIELVFSHENKPIVFQGEHFFFVTLKHIFLNNHLYSLGNFLNIDSFNYFLNKREIISQDKESFDEFRNELLQYMDHRVFAGDSFNLPKNEVLLPYVVHVKLPIISNSVTAKLVQKTPELTPPFESLTIFQDNNSEIYEKFISSEVQQTLGVDGLFKIPTESFHDFILKSSQLGLQIIADKAIIRPSSQFNLSVTHDMNWFEAQGSMQIDGKELLLPEILKKLKGNETFIELGNGEKAYIPSKWLSKVLKLNDMGEYIDGKFVIHQSRALQLESLEVSSIDLSEFILKIKNFKNLPDVKMTKAFQGKLREYQFFSLKWMKFLREIGLGGCLADDMGLGKTVQVAANLQIRKKEASFSNLPHLIVCPKSLVFNWKNELERFTPNLKVEVIESGKIDLSKIKSDIAITTYGLVQRNCERFQDTQFDYIVLDEAQAIKNPRSLTAKTIFTLNANHRLALTGTPIENHIGELYSIFNFLMPGAYKKAALNPDNKSKGKAQALRPFILRRTKSQVLTDLPDRVDQVIFCEQETIEKKQYTLLKEYIRENLGQKNKDPSQKGSSFMVLEALTRLRQASCHPGLLNPDLKDIETGKLNQLKSMIGDIIQEDHKIVIFSQFTSLLKLTREYLAFNEKNSSYLDGQTKDREKVVSEFQNSSEKKVFFISLKAGGTGLNLTEASYCFLLDPWWNPAVEEQAIARLHRIGQKKSVNVYRLITKDTVEEKVLELQKIKHDIVKDIISDENEGFLKTLSGKDLSFLLE